LSENGGGLLVANIEPGPLPEHGGCWLVANIEAESYLNMVEAGWLPILRLTFV
jgi:hypothetical protein